MIAALVLAAGRSRRMGAAKVLLPVSGAAMVSRVASSAAAAGARPVVVVEGPFGLRDALAWPAGTRVVRAADHDMGQSASLRAGLGALGPHVAAAVVVLGDEPEVSADALRAVMRAFDPSGCPVVRARYADGPGHPVLLARRVWPLLAAGHGDTGAARLLRWRPDLVREVRVPGPRPIDVDTPEDYQRLTSRG